MKCPFCQGTYGPPIHQDLVQCQKCGIFRRNNIPPKKVLLRNGANFMLSATQNEERTQKRLASATRQLNGANPFVKTRAHMFDVGAASGFMMKIAQDMGWTSVEGNEISTRAIEWAKKRFGFDIQYGFLEDLQLSSSLYDMVTLWNTLEHTADPVLTLEIVRRMLAPQGLMYLELPCKNNRAEVAAHYEHGHWWEFGKTNLIEYVKTQGFELLNQVIFDKGTGPHQDILFRKTG